jgi:hypothetical protein
LLITETTQPTNDNSTVDGGNTNSNEYIGDDKGDKGDHGNLIQQSYAET